jgi:hypothetical protein
LHSDPREVSWISEQCGIQNALIAFSQKVVSTGTILQFFQADFDSGILIAIRIAIENLFWINQTLIFIFQANLD